MINNIVEMFKRYSKFDTKSTRSEYWGVILITWGIGLGLWLSFTVLSGVMLYTFGTSGSFVSGLLLLAALAASLLLLWVGIATTVRRCKDAGINPWFTAAVFIPYVGWIAAIVIGVLESKQA